MKPEEPTNPVPPQDRARGGSQKDSKGGMLAGLDLGSMLGELKLNIGLDEQDKSALKEAINNMTDKMEYRWIITQRLMIAAIGLAVIGQLVNWGLGL